MCAATGSPRSCTPQRAQLPQEHLRGAVNNERDRGQHELTDKRTFSQKIRYTLERESAARSERRMMKLLKASRTPNMAACVEDIHYLPDRSLNREVVARLAACRWLDQARNLVILGFIVRGEVVSRADTRSGGLPPQRHGSLLATRRPREPARRSTVLRSCRVEAPWRIPLLRPARAGRPPHDSDHE